VGEQAQALAAGDLDHAVLGGAVPGVLGESVQASVEQLSRSIREQEALRSRLAEQAHHDALTGLLNRAGFLVVLEDALARARDEDRQVALLFVDLDGFKRANDSHGHSFGDDVLRLTAARIGTVSRVGDTVARLGGDEFVVIAEGIDGVDAATRLGERLVSAVSVPIELGGRTARIGASVGVAVSEDARVPASDLLADADQAVYRAKRSGRGRVEVCNDALRREVAERNDIEAALRNAIHSGELELHYQPVVDTSTQDLKGFEALVRWRRPGYGLVPPADFIPVAEASDLVIDLGRWVLAEATSQLVRWSSSPGMAGAHVSVNVSGRHLLNGAVVDDVREALEHSGLAADRLVVEITETVILADLDVAVAHLDALRALGVRIALDDFGTGYTSIGQLGRLPVDILKIDRAFVSELDQHQDRSIVELMVEVAHTLGLGLVAEGVEEAGQLGILQELTCDDVQGYLISRPMEAGDVHRWAAGQPSAIPEVALVRNLR
jgi:diguanylate cyclase (GGDEF)-like protein